MLPFFPFGQRVSVTVLSFGGAAAEYTSAIGGAAGAACIGRGGSKGGRAKTPLVPLFPCTRRRAFDPVAFIPGVPPSPP